MIERTFATPRGLIHYWINGIQLGRKNLVFLPGLTADHRLFDKQIEYFADRFNVLVWDAPGHAASRPFALDFSLTDKASWLHGLLRAEGIEAPILIGQSMGGYVAQAYAGLFPQALRGFVSIDSAPLQRKYMSAAELWLLRRMEVVYRLYPWKLLLRDGTNGVACSDYGRTLMREIMMTYDGQHAQYAQLCGHGYRMLADAVAADLPYALSCPVLLLCGAQDRAGSCIRYNAAWHRDTGFPLEWIKNAGHNANTDQPEIVNALIERFVNQIA